MIHLHDVWAWGPHVARRCKACGCDPEHPCTVVLPEELGTACCVPAGVYHRTRCSKCKAGMVAMPRSTEDAA
jgi:hypothetical protein